MSATLLPLYQPISSSTTATMTMTTVVEQVPGSDSSYSPSSYGALTINLRAREKPFIQAQFENYLQVLDRSPLRTKMLTVGSVTAFSAIVAGLLKDANPLHLSMRLLVTLFVIGISINAPPYHFLYDFLEKQFPTSRKINVLVHLVIDQLLAAPVYVFFYLFVKMFLMGSFTIDSFTDIMTTQFLPILQLMWMIYPVTQGINFAFIPAKFRVLFCTLVSFVVNALIAYFFTSATPAQTKTAQLLMIPFK